MRRLKIAAATCVLGSLTAGAWAVCPSGMPSELFCDDFDCYCSGAPCQQTPPTKCAIGAVKDNLQMMQVWVKSSRNDANGNICGMDFNVEDSSYAFSLPFGNRYPCQSHIALGQMTVDLINRIESLYNGQYDSVIGTDLHPLVLSYNMNGTVGGKIWLANAYMELASDDDRAPTNFVYGPDCNTFCSPSVVQAPLPIICAQNAAVPGCPDVTTAPTHASIAVGVLAYLDPDPCHCVLNQHGSKNEHLAFFDGKQWWTLNTGLFPGSGDFSLHNDRAVIKLTVMSKTVQVELTSEEPDPDEYSIAIIPRQYQGRFNKLRSGYGAHCELNSSSWSCASIPCKCLVKGAPSAGAVIYDDVVLYGGAGFTNPGACCYGDNQCTEVIPLDCESLSGTWKGYNTTCASRVCCPDPFADMDRDTDVDMSDFAALQRCLTLDGGGPVTIESNCGCLDKDGNGVIGSSDVDSFISCASGAGVPAILSCDN